MGSSHSGRKHTAQDTAKAAAGAETTPAAEGRETAGKGQDAAPPTAEEPREPSDAPGDAGQDRPEGDRRTAGVPLPSLEKVADGAMNAAMFPVAVARQVLPRKKGLPLYLGLGALGAAEVIEWPVAVGIGVGYAVLRGHGLPAGPGTAAGAPAPESGAERPGSAGAAAA
ncbi:hypothetical protein [Streptomyces sp. NPDC018031]|uniref:hypothetical protein n=1 Tax=Streptomyces sp. NPDC018031 TaxID=3365033 RepID=UPI00378967BB